MCEWLRYHLKFDFGVTVASSGGGMYADVPAKHTVWTWAGAGGMRLRRWRRAKGGVGLAQLVFRERAGERQSLLRSAFLSEGVEADIGDVREEGRRRTLECLGCGCAVDWVAAKRAATLRAKRRMAKVYVFHGDPEIEAVLYSGDGCHCRARRRPTSARRRVLAAMASELEAGTRVLVAWPEHVDDVELWGRPIEARDRVVAKARGVSSPR